MAAEMVARAVVAFAATSISAIFAPVTASLSAIAATNPLERVISCEPSAKVPTLDIV